MYLIPYKATKPMPIWWKRSFLVEIIDTLLISLYPFIWLMRHYPPLSVIARNRIPRFTQNRLRNPRGFSLPWWEGVRGRGNFTFTLTLALSRQGRGILMRLLRFARNDRWRGLAMTKGGGSQWQLEKGAQWQGEGLAGMRFNYCRKTLSTKS